MYFSMILRDFSFVMSSDDRLIPFVLNDVVKEVDTKNRIMIVEWDWDWN